MYRGTSRAGVSGSLHSTPQSFQYSCTSLHITAEVILDYGYFSESRATGPRYGYDEQGSMRVHPSFCTTSPTRDSSLFASYQLIPILI
jgi:hypothetical protein